MTLKMQPTFVEEMKRLRLDKGWSQARLADEVCKAWQAEGVGLTAEAIKYLECGRSTKANSYTVRKVARIFPELSRFIPE